MKIEHIALGVESLEEVKQFFMQYFQATSNNRYHNPKTGLSTYILSFEEGARLELMHWENPQKQTSSSAPCHPQKGYIHLSFSVGTPEKVDTLTRELEAAGYHTLSGPRVTGDGYYESTILGPEGNLIEITV